MGEGGTKGSTAEQGDGRDHCLAENRDWRQETGRERRGRLQTAMGGERWEKGHTPTHSLGAESLGVKGEE